MSLHELSYFEATVCMVNYLVSLMGRKAYLHIYKIKT